MPRFTFHTTHFTKVDEHRYKPTSIEVEADNAEIAYRKVIPQVPVGFRVFCWYSDIPVKDEEKDLDSRSIRTM